MTNRFVWVAWNRHKRIYDAILVSTIAVYLIAFIGASVLVSASPIDPMVALIRATGSLGIVLLHVILCIGPLARLSDLFAPVLYNRRHLGVTMFLVGLVHAALVMLYYGGFGSLDPISAVLLAGRSFDSITAFPFELLGFAGLLILFVMAATSHDFWLDLLRPAIWKWIHMAVYVAYAVLVSHVALGAASTGERGTLPLVLLGIGFVLVVSLHLITGLREMTRDQAGVSAISDESEEENLGGRDDPLAGPGFGEESRAGWVDVGSVDEIPEDRAKVVCLAGAERVAVFRHEGRISAVSNVCAHQAGPLGEGKIVNGCVTCPWHGYQYHAHNGQSPPPYSEKIPTYRVRVEGRTVLVDPTPLPAGTPVEPAFFEASAEDERLFEEPDVDRADASMDLHIGDIEADDVNEVTRDG